MKVQRAEIPAILAGHTAAQSFFASCFDAGTKGSEQLFVAHLDDGARCLELSRHDGHRDGVGLPVRSIIADAMRLGSAGVILAHNHPSGDATPSADDCRATRKLALAGEAIDLAVVDHLVFAHGGDCRSFRRLGLL